LLDAFRTEGVNYERLFFVLTEGEESVAAVIGHTPSDDPVIGWRYDLLVDEIPITDEVGGTGRAQRREFADLIVALFDDKLFAYPPPMYGRILPYAQYAGMVSGYIHPATATNTYALGAAHSMSRRSDWFSDFPRFDKGEAHTKTYVRGHDGLLDDLRGHGVGTNEQYKMAVRKIVLSWKARPAQPNVK
jgi:hypothetical protein